MLHELKALSLRLPVQLRQASAGVVEAHPITSPKDLAFLGLAEDILAQMGCIYTQPEGKTSVPEKKL